MRVVVIGAGAAGCFTAIMSKRLLPAAEVIVLESGARALAKVAVTGGGRCNLTNTFKAVDSLARFYPRGERLMKRLLREFSHRDVYEWFEREGVKLMTQEDERVFPESEDAMEIVNTLLRLMQRLGVVLRLNHSVKAVTKDDMGFHIGFNNTSLEELVADIVVVAVGGCSKIEKLAMLKSFQLEIVPPVPSLFSFCLPGHPLTGLPGISVENVALSICGTKFKSTGALLVTHRGVSGPAVLKLSSYAARYLSDCSYEATLSINWMGVRNEIDVNEMLISMSAGNKLKQLQSAYPVCLNARLWIFLLSEAGLEPTMRWAELGKKGRNRLSSLLTNYQVGIKGKNKFKDEFVTCGGIALGNVEMRTLECRTCDGLYFAGEVLDVDAITGGFNLQAAWTMGAVVAKAVQNKWLDYLHK